MKCAPSWNRQDALPSKDRLKIIPFLLSTKKNTSPLNCRVFWKVSLPQNYRTTSDVDYYEKFIAFVSLQESNTKRTVVAAVESKFIICCPRPMNHEVQTIDRKSIFHPNLLRINYTLYTSLFLAFIFWFRFEERKNYTLPIEQ